MKKQPVISDAEWKVMQRLWAKAPQPSFDLAEALAEAEGWSASTVKTMLARLHKKGAVKISHYKNLFLYAPAVTEEACVQAESEDFLQRIFGGAVKPLLVHFARQEKLTAADLDELRTILKKKEK